MSEHTKTPWFVHDFTELFGDDPRQVTISCVHPDTITVCAMDRALTAGISEAKANARHIVHCVNNHERLVEVLRSVNWNMAADWGAVEIDDAVKASALLGELDAGEGGE